MLFHDYRALATAASLFLQACVAQDLNDTIVGCADVQCPDNSENATPDCRVINDTFVSIGLARIPAEVDTLKGISWVQGNGAIDHPNANRTYVKNFYLGTPPGFSLNNTGACALFFGNVSNNVDFPGQNLDLDQGTCAEAMSEGCVSKLISRAEGLDYSGLSTEEACEKLEKEFQDNVDSECESFSRDGKWLNLTSIPLSGPDGVKAITSVENGTSNCWPIEPKSYDLSLVRATQSEGDYRAETIVEKLGRITPILTLFFPNGSDGAVSQAAGQMTCMKTIVNSVTGEKNKDAGNEGGVLTVSLGMMLLIAAISLIFAV